MNPRPSISMTRSARSPWPSAPSGRWMVSKEKARIKTLPCCWPTKSCSRLTGSRVASFTARSWSSRLSLPGQQQRGPDETGDDAEKVEHPDAHDSVERVRVGERTQRAHIGVHDAVEHGMK